MSFWTLISILSSIFSILGFFISDKFKSNRWAYFAFTFITLMACGYAVNYNSELERIKNIHEQASSILDDYNFTSDEAFIHEVLIFLEENGDRYPDTYKRANKSIEDLENRKKLESNVAKEFYGILKGITHTNKDK